MSKYNGVGDDFLMGGFIGLLIGILFLTALFGN